MDAWPEAVRFGAVRYIDASILVRAYLRDEAGHDAAKAWVFSDDSLVVTSAVSDVELTSAIRAAARAGRIANADRLLRVIRTDLDVDGRFIPIALDGAPTLRRARALCDMYRLRSLDAIHLAVALSEGTALAEGLPFAFTTADTDQAEAARREGLRVEMP